MRATTLLVAVFAGLLIATPAWALGTDQPAAGNCFGEAEDARALAAGDSGGEEEEEDEDAPPKFSPGFYKRAVTLDASLDGLDGRDLPISIEEVCDVPKAHAKDATQLAGSDGIALVLPRTTVWQDGVQLTGEAATTAVDGADTALIRGRLIRQSAWREDEDGARIPTFRSGRIEVTD
jgi:hypothetical protein